LLAALAAAVIIILAAGAQVECSPAPQRSPVERQLSLSGLVVPAACLQLPEPMEAIQVLDRLSPLRAAVVVGWFRAAAVRSL
jgi:hypothetical protein